MPWGWALYGDKEHKSLYCASFESSAPWWAAPVIGYFSSVGRRSLAPTLGSPTLASQIEAKSISVSKHTAKEITSLHQNAIQSARNMYMAVFSEESSLT